VSIHRRFATARGWLGGLERRRDGLGVPVWLGCGLLLAAGLTACSGPSQETNGVSLGAPDTSDRAEEAKVPLSQEGTVNQRIAEAQVSITYYRPVARGRTILGEVVRYDTAWSPGANRATQVFVSHDLRVNDHELPAGTYSLWMIPGRERWTVIFSSQADTFHQPYPGKAFDRLRFDVAASTGTHMETLLFYFPVVDGRTAELRLHWGETVVPMTIVVPD
jgi:hypothetical protein